MAPPLTAAVQEVNVVSSSVSAPSASSIFCSALLMTAPLPVVKVMLLKADEVMVEDAAPLILIRELLTNAVPETA